MESREQIIERNRREKREVGTRRVKEGKGRIKNAVFRHIKTNNKEYLIALVLFFIGVTVGVLLINNTSEDQGIVISEYLNNFITSLKEKASVDKFGLLKESVIDNAGLTILLWFVGSTVIGIPIVCGVVVYRGFSIGYTIASILASFGTGKGLLFAFITVGLKNLIFIPCLLALCVSGFKLSKSILKDKRKENIKLEIYRHTFFSLFIGILILISSLLESYVTPMILEWIIPSI